MSSLLRRFIHQVARPAAESVSARVIVPAARALSPIADKLGFSLLNSAEEQQKNRVERPSSLLVVRLSERDGWTAEPQHTRVPALRPLRSLGGLSLAAYMAIEATEGHFHMWRTWQVDLASDLQKALGQVTAMRRELDESEDRIEDLEIMVNDLTSFVEVQKDEIARLKAHYA